MPVIEKVKGHKKFDICWYSWLLVIGKKVMSIVGPDENKWKFTNSISMKKIINFIVHIALLDG